MISTKTRATMRASASELTYDVRFSDGSFAYDKTAADLANYDIQGYSYEIIATHVPDGYTGSIASGAPTGATPPVGSSTGTGGMFAGLSTTTLLIIGIGAILLLKG